MKNNSNKNIWLKLNCEKEQDEYRQSGCELDSGALIMLRRQCRYVSGDHGYLLMIYHPSFHRPPVLLTFSLSLSLSIIYQISPSFILHLSIIYNLSTIYLCMCVYMLVEISVVKDFRIKGLQTKKLVAYVN